MMLFLTIVESVDLIINAIEDRFDQEDFRTHVKVENLLLKVTLVRFLNT